MTTSKNVTVLTYNIMIHNKSKSWNIIFTFTQKINI